MRNHLIPASPVHRVGRQHDGVAARGKLYSIRINGRLGATGLSAFPSLTYQLTDRETVLTGWIEDRSALFGVLAQIERLGLELLEVRQVPGEANADD